MRVRPPETDKEYFNENEFRDHLFKHEVVGKNKCTPILEELIQTFKHCKSKKLAVEEICSMLPYQYQYRAAIEFYDYLDNNYQEKWKKET